MHSQQPQTLAAVDLGSNSFHLIVAQIDNGQLQIVDRLKEMVRLGAGLDKDHQISPKVQQRALQCLSRFGQRLRDLPQDAVSVVGTNTMRQISDGGQFLNLAETVLGHPIEIIAGREEARLVYLGVAHGLDHGKEKRLVIDIGGGSTELIIGKGMKVNKRESLFMGCVSYRRFFPAGNISKAAMKKAIIAARLEIRPYQLTYEAKHWRVAIGSSGTIRAIRNVVQAAGWSKSGISKKSLKKLRQHLIAAKHADNLSLEELTDDRRPVFAAGVAVLSALFKTLKIKRMHVSDMALREGLLYELVGGIQHHDVRGRTVDTMVKRYGLDRRQGHLVADTAVNLLQQLQPPENLACHDPEPILYWAGRLHEIGLAISHSGFHKHGAYILMNADLPGFSRQQQIVLSTLVRVHRRKFSTTSFNALQQDVRRQTIPLGIILRLAALLHRGRNPRGKPNPKIFFEDNEIQITFPDNWLQRNPLTQAEMAQEQKYLAIAGWSLSFC